MKPELDFGQMDEVEASAVKALLAGRIICGCGADTSTYHEQCGGDLPCPGFLCVEGARLHLRRRAA